MKASYWQRGEALDYTNTGETKIEHGTVVIIGKRIGVAGTDILPGELGTLHITGVYEMHKADTTEIPVGTEVYFTAAGITAEGASGSGETTVQNVPAGFAAVTAEAADDKIYVKING